MSRSWREALRDWSDTRLVTVLLLGFSSGLPLILTLSTLSAWLKEEAGYQWIQGTRPQTWRSD